VIEDNTMSNETIKTELLQASLSAYTSGYRVLADDWRNLDTKAQGTVAIAGVFLAGAFGFVKSITDRKPQIEGSVAVVSRFCLISTEKCVAKGTVESGLLALAVVGLFSAILLAVLSLRVRSIRSPSGEEVDTMARDAATLIGTADESGISDRFIAEQRLLWLDAVEETFREYLQKAKHLARAQLAILLGATSVAVLTLIEIFNA
jgi:hypothetical protein